MSDTNGCQRVKSRHGAPRWTYVGLIWALLDRYLAHPTLRYPLTQHAKIHLLFTVFRITGPSYGLHHVSGLGQAVQSC